MTSSVADGVTARLLRIDLVPGLARDMTRRLMLPLGAVEHDFRPAGSAFEDELGACCAIAQRYKRAPATGARGWEGRASGGHPPDWVTMFAWQMSEQPHHL